MKKGLLPVVSLVLSFILLPGFSPSAVSENCAQINAGVYSVSAADSGKTFLEKIREFFYKIMKLFNKLFKSFSVPKRENDQTWDNSGKFNVINPISPLRNNSIDVKKNFGAKGDGVTDDTAAIQSALNFFHSIGGTIVIPDGVYIVSKCLVFYSNQKIQLSDGAVLKRSSSAPSLRYLLASYTSSNQSDGGYNGVHDAVISGGTMDGNAEINQKITILNLCHTKNVTVENVHFIHGCFWHCIEVNSSLDATVKNCVFDGSSYTALRTDSVLNELLQIDGAEKGLYGPVYYHDGTEMTFVSDKTPCRNVNILNNKFICNTFSAIGDHVDFPHDGIIIRGNEFSGNPGRGRYCHFTKSVSNVVDEDNIREFAEDYSYDLFEEETTEISTGEIKENASKPSSEQSSVGTEESKDFSEHTN